MVCVLWNQHERERPRQHLVLRQVRTRLHFERRQSDLVLKTWAPCMELFRCHTGEVETFFDTMRLTTNISDNHLHFGEGETSSHGGAKATAKLQQASVTSNRQ